MVGTLTWALAGLSALGASYASPDLGARAGCPYAVGVSNGGFETGHFAPWQLVPHDPGMNPPQRKIVSPGYKSQHALELNFAASNDTNWTFLQNQSGKECMGYSYTITYAYNWVNYKGPQSGVDVGCKLTVATSYCVQEATHYATCESGWHAHTYTCLNAYSCGPAGADFVVDVDCEGGNKTIPAFTLLMDNFSIKLADRPSSAIPSPTCF
jgi:hypothetical protein